MRLKFPAIFRHVFRRRRDWLMRSCGLSTPSTPSTPSQHTQHDEQLLSAALAFRAAGGVVSARSWSALSVASRAALGAAGAALVRDRAEVTLDLIVEGLTPSEREQAESMLAAFRATLDRGAA